MFQSRAFQDGIELYKSVAHGKRPEFIDENLGQTRIRMEQGEFSLTTEKHKFSIAAPNGDTLQFTYKAAEVRIAMTRPGSGELFHLDWDFTDPQAYKGKLAIDGGEEAWEGDHNTYLIAIHDKWMQRKSKEQTPQRDQSIPPSPLYHFFVWNSLSDDFKFEVRRRVAAGLPRDYFVAHTRARASNLIGCATACWLCAISLAAVPGTPDDFIWCGLCLACTATGFIA